MSEYNIDFQPLGRRGQSKDGESILDCARRLRIGISSVCGGVGTCGKCRVRVLEGNVSEPTFSEEDFLSEQDMNSGWRLSCQTYPTGDIKIHVPADSMTTPQRMQLEGIEVGSAVAPPVKEYQVTLAQSSLINQAADAERLLGALREQHGLDSNKIDYSVLQSLPDQLRHWNSHFQVAVRDKEVVAVLHPSKRQIGFAVDLGSTKLAGYLINMANGQTIASRGVMNPQISYGEDIISRISVASTSPEKALDLQKLIVEAFNQLAWEMCQEIGAEREEIVEAVVVANTAMHHLFLRLPVRQLAVHPFVAAISGAMDVKARDIGLHFAPGAYVHVLPNIAMFVGADHVAALLATEVWRKDKPTIIIDIGTNTEVSFVCQNNITAASCASGPALEGGHIKDGMRAGDGAIERVKITQDNVIYQTINDAPAVGICGSGILDVVAQMYIAGVIDASGRMKEGHPRVRQGVKGKEFVLVEAGDKNGNPPVVFTQQDVRQVQLGKSAIRAGIQMLLEANDCSTEEINEVLIAGAFGSYIDVASAVAIGMFPPLPLEKFRQVGNAAGTGARQALVSLGQRAQAQSIAARVRHLELSTAPYFNQTFSQAMSLGKYILFQGKREELI